MPAPHLIHGFYSGKSALANIEQQVRGEEAMHSARTVPQLSQVVKPLHRVGLRAHYVSAKSARNDIDSYFDHMGNEAERENEDNAKCVRCFVVRTPASEKRLSSHVLHAICTMPCENI